jgi:hypothetical protein
MKRECRCREPLDPTTAERIPIKNKAGEVVDKHDCDYVAARNRLIPRAEAEAEAAVARSTATGPARSMEFARAFMAAMNRLAIEAGLVEPVLTNYARAAA